MKRILKYFSYGLWSSLAATIFHVLITINFLFSKEQHLTSEGVVFGLALLIGAGLPILLILTPTLTLINMRKERLKSVWIPLFSNTILSFAFYAVMEFCLLFGIAIFG